MKIIFVQLCILLQFMRQSLIIYSTMMLQGGNYIYNLTFSWKRAKQKSMLIIQKSIILNTIFLASFIKKSKVKMLSANYITFLKRVCISKKRVK